MPEDVKINGEVCIKVLDYIIEKLLVNYVKYYLQESAKVGTTIENLVSQDERKPLMLLYEQKRQSYLVESLFEVLCHYMSLKAWAQVLYEHSLLECKIEDNNLDITYDINKLVKRISTS